MQRQQLEVSVRDQTGKGAARKARTAGQVPAVLYGTGIETISLQIEAQRLQKVLSAGANVLVDLKGPKEVKNKLVLLKEVQCDPVSQRPLHCDFYAVDTSKQITVDVPLHFVGRAKGSEMGGILEPLVRELAVRCLPLAIPEAMKVDVTELEIGQSVHLSDLTLPDGVEAVDEPTLSIVHVTAPRVEEEPTEVEEELAVGEEEAAPAEKEGEKPKPEAGESGAAE